MNGPAGLWKADLAHDPVSFQKCELSPTGNTYLYIQIWVRVHASNMHMYVRLCIHRPFFARARHSLSPQPWHPLEAGGAGDEATSLRASIHDKGPVGPPQRRFVLTFCDSRLQMSVPSVLDTRLHVKASRRAHGPPCPPSLVLRYPLETWYAYCMSQYDDSISPTGSDEGGTRGNIVSNNRESTSTPNNAAPCSSGLVLVPAGARAPLFTVWSSSL